VKLDGGVHLTYCSNIHPGETWDEVRASLGTWLPKVRETAAPGMPFGVGLRLSALAADALTAPDALAEFRKFLAMNDLYVFTLNGFPYGRFHGVPVKEAVYRPDWRDPERLRYTNVIADLLAALLPEDRTLEGSVSTVPVGYKTDVITPADIAAATEHLVRHVAHLVDIERRTGRRITLALEPEPCCYLETIDESVAFFRRHLFTAAAARRLSSLTGLDRADSAAALARHLGLCLDLCHAAVEFEDLDAGLDKLAQAGVGIFKVQISAGLRIRDFAEPVLQRLRAYQDTVYLHQVVENGPEGLRRFVDLPQAFASLSEPAQREEWRVHFHVPIFHDDLGSFHSTRDFIERALTSHRRQQLSRHLEVETYTWNVLPEALRGMPVDTAIARELAWVRTELAR
jgi:sugar phosphate isomerase/epimerase